ncbi:MAG TPA: DUF6423 family protein [Mycobacteriales bacterium]|jgi:hypothetical protein|nr:DUF6423 family protein [Mycobacteriales bacterium]
MSSIEMPEAGEPAPMAAPELITAPGEAEMPGLDVSSRVRARDIQMAAVADVRRRVLMVTGAIDTSEHDVSVSMALPEPGRWMVIKSETNLTDQTWMAMQVTCDEESSFVDDPDTAVLSRQFAKSFMTPDLRRLSFFGGEVRPGEAVLTMFSMEFGGVRPVYAHARYTPVSTGDPESMAERLDRLVADGLPQRPVVELIVPVTVVG